jgi:hypothetical protein
MINYPTVYLFGYPIVKATVSRLHMVDRNTKALGHNGRKSAVGVAENQESVGLFGEQDPFGSRDDLTYLLAKGLAAHSQKVIWPTHLELIEKQIAKPRIKVLPSVDKNVLIGETVELFDDLAQTNNFGPRA